MALKTQSVKTASDAWKLLKGLVCVYKPAEYPIRSFTEKIKSNLVEDLNGMKRSIESNYVHPMDIESSNGNSDDSPSFQIEKYESDFANLVPPDYSRHPLVLGKGIFKLIKISIKGSSQNHWCEYYSIE